MVSALSTETSAHTRKSNIIQKLYTYVDLSSSMRGSQLQSVEQQLSQIYYQQRNYKPAARLIKMLVHIRLPSNQP